MTELICPDCSSGFLEEVSQEFLELEIPESYEFDSYFGDEDTIVEDLLTHRRLLSQFFDDREEESSPNSELDASGLATPEEERDYSRLNTILPVNADYISEGEAQLLRMRFFDDFSSDSEVDALASQLLDEVDISGPPPLMKDQIKALPVVILTEAHVGSELQCTVCMNDYKIGEKAKQLTCEHLFHEKCIAPWLERQASCPNCRRTIKVEGKSKRSLSCPRTLNIRPRSSNSSNRRFSEVSSLGDFFTASMNMNPFRFL
ncbi:E3 ubiquitin-protein ligase RNF126 isoform X2 [Parasteatoda tepidariorum]|uniref:E3 ubiquitin-protein ligase RNF126 isoform X2 n=1 Tax=Parasteatoda tepidariorum TaxID=114398 RepID=UPI001C7230A8|nr:E3 ubiquitin-protein ligase RNF126 isoform X2 [Parasteatoda tepidariorum]